MNLNIDQYLKDLSYIVNIDSGTGNIEGNWKTADFFARRLEAAGYEMHILQAGEGKRPVVIAATPDAQTYEYYLGGHLDTVFPDGTVQARPFTIDAEEGCAYGPGTIDMKSGALLILYLAEALGQTHPEIPLCIVLNSDEEIGSQDSVEILRAWGAKCRRAFIFEGGRKEGRLVKARKGIAKYRIEVEGIASHAGTAPWDGASAVVELAHWITRLDKLKNYDKGTAINTGLIEGGAALNVVAPYAAAMIEVRYSDPKELTRVERALHRFAEKPKVKGTKTAFTKLSHYPPLLPTEKTLQWMEELREYDLQYVKAGGISDANRLASLGIPIIDGCGPQGGFPHSDKEFLRIETVTQRFNLFYDIISKTTSKQ